MHLLHLISSLLMLLLWMLPRWIIVRLMCLRLNRCVMSTLLLLMCKCIIVCRSHQLSLLILQLL